MALVVLLAGCSGSTEPTDFLLVTSDAESYLLGQTAMLTVTNPSRHAVTVAQCSGGPPSPQRRVDRFENGEWTDVGEVQPNCANANTSGPLLLRTGESMVIGVSHLHASHVGTVRVRLMDGATRLGVSNIYTVIAD